MNEELRWMLTSIIHLLQAKDFYGAFATCLNAIEPLAAKRYPKLENGERFQRFLHEERQPFWAGNVYLPDANKSRQGVTIRLPDNFSSAKAQDKEQIYANIAKLKESLITIEQVLWKYCRNPIVHEGSQLAIDGDTAVTLDWSVPQTTLSIKVDQEAKNVIVISAPFLLNVLYQIVAKHLADPERAPLKPIEKTQSSKIVSWTMSQEREFIENLLCQRFNFFIVFFGLVVAGTVASRSERLSCVILWSGAFICLFLATTLFRAQHKLDFILNGFFENDKSHPATIVHVGCKDAWIGSVRHVIGYGIPSLCTLLLFVGAFLAQFGELLKSS